MSHRFKKRERTQNWSPEEKILLLKLCEDRLDVLESKRGDQISISKKANAWKEIRGEFVAALGIERDVSRLKEQWQRMKCQARADLQDFAMRLKKFGPEIANQKRPNQMSAEVWRVMESARKYFLHMNGNDSEEDASTKEINWSLSEANGPECDAAPSLLCETEVRNSSEDANCENGAPNYLYEENCDSGASNYLYPYHLNGFLAECPSPNPLNPLTNQAKLDYYAKRDFVLTALANAQQQRNELDPSRTDPHSPSEGPENSEKPDKADDEDLVHSLSLFFESKKLEQQKRLQLMDEQMKTAKLYRETAELQKQIAQQQLKHSLINFKENKDRAKSSHDFCSRVVKDINHKDDEDDDDYGEDNRKRLKEDIKERLLFHEEQIRFHQEAIERHKQRLLEFDK